jgi:pimeloyl-ACP methyl ester carboxylesterase
MAGHGFSKSGLLEYINISRGSPTLLLLPGWCQHHTIFRHVGPLLAAGYPVVSVGWRDPRDAPATSDFDTSQVVDEVLSIIDETKPTDLVPVSISHAGWLSIELRRKLGERVKSMVLLDWLVLDPPPPFLGALRGLQDPAEWRKTREQLFGTWIGESKNAEVIAHIREEMAAFDAEMWSRAGREIEASYRRHGTPLAALAALDSPPPTLHLYAQPPDEAHLAAQQEFARRHPWFHVRRLAAKSHFPTLESAPKVAAAIDTFIGAVDSVVDIEAELG